MGANIIQESVSLDDEDEDGCIELVLGFHKKIESWWNDVLNRGPVFDGPVTGLEKIWLKEDSAKYGNFVPVPCCTRWDAYHPARG